MLKEIMIMFVCLGFVNVGLAAYCPTADKIKVENGKIQLPEGWQCPSEGCGNFSSNYKFKIASWNTPQFKSKSVICNYGLLQSSKGFLIISQATFNTPPSKSWTCHQSVSQTSNGSAIKYCICPSMTQNVNDCPF